MSAFFILLLIIAVWALWDRVGSLRRRLEEVERALNERPRDRPVVQPAAESPTRQAVAEAYAVTKPVVQDTAFESPAPVRSQPWNPPQEPQHDPLPEPALIRMVRSYFTGGNLIVRVGIIVLFFGVAFLLKYAAEHTQISIQVRLAGVAVGAAVLFVLGWRLRHRRRGFALALQGGSIGVLYLTLFIALRLYQLVSPDVTFALMAALGVVSSLLAVRQDSLAMSFLGATGGFLAPVLASTGEGSHVVLFSYYALLDLGIVAQAWFKAWRPLNLLAFVFTFGVGTAWGVTRYDPSQFATTEPFLLFFFLAFIAIAVRFAFRRAPQLTHYVDGTLVFGTPLVAFALQMALVRDISHGRAWSATGAGLIYLALAAWLNRTQRETLRLLMESFLALGVAFLTLAVPLWMDDSWTAITWALEGAALFWIGLRQERRLSIAAGVLLQIAAAAVFLSGLEAVAAPEVPVANAQCMCALFLSIAGLLSARFASKHAAALQPFGQAPANALLVWGLGWWIYTGANELHVFMSSDWLPGSLLIYCALTALACGVLVRPLAWPALGVPALLILPVMIAAASWWFLAANHPVRHGGWLAWPVAFAAWWCCMWRNEESVGAQLGGWMHGAALWMLALLVSWEIHWQVDSHVMQVTLASTAWAGAAWGLVPAAMLEFIIGRGAERVWPTRQYREYSLSLWAFGLAVLLGGWSLWEAFQSDGSSDPLPYLPLLNPLDLSLAVALFVVVRWLRLLWNEGEALVRYDHQRVMIGVLVGVIFLCLNAVLLRTMHHWRDIPYKLDRLLDDTAVHTALSIFWTVLALGAMLWANRSLRRLVWFCGAALMAVVVIKLFLVDLASIGTVPRIVSFLVVGGLMLVIGYYSPLPPAPEARRAP